MLLFGLLNVPAVQERAKGIIVEKLKEKIGTKLGIGRLHFKPFNEIELTDVYLYGQDNEKILLAHKVSAGVDLMALMDGQLDFTSAHLDDFEVHLSKDSLNAPLNIQYIIDAFKPKDNAPKSDINVALSAVTISGGKVFYDIKNEPEKENVFDKNHIHISDLNAKLALKSLKSDSLNIQVKKFELKEKSGLEITNLVFRLLTRDKKISLRGFQLDMPSSLLTLSRCELDLTPTSDTAKLPDYARFDLQIGASSIAPKDIAGLLPALKNYKSSLELQGSVSGTVDNFSVTDLILAHGNKMHLTANAEVRDIRNRENTYLIGNIEELSFDSDEAENILNDFSPRKMNLPPFLKKMGMISFEGDVSGYLKQLTAFGSLETRFGILKTDVLFGLNPRKGLDSYVQGKIHTTNFNLGLLTNNKKLGNVSLDLEVNTEKPASGKIKGTAKGRITDLDFDDYTYKEILLDADYDGMKFNGQVNLDDPNGQLWINGLFDLSDKDNPELNFAARVKNIQLDKLHIAEKLAHSYLSFSVDADFKGKNIDEAEGAIRVDSVDFLWGDKVFTMDKFLIEVLGNEENRNISITSDILSGEIKGSYSLLSMAGSIQKTLHPLLPALIKQNGKKTPDEKTNIMDFKFNINNTENLSSIFNIPVILYSPATITGSYNNIHDTFELDVLTPSLKAAGMNIREGHIHASAQNEEINADINIKVLGKKESINDIAIQSKVKDNRIDTHIALTNDGFQKAKGNFFIQTLFVKEDGKPLLVDIGVLPSKLLLNNANWEMDKAHIGIQGGVCEVDNFRVYNEKGSQEIKINGKYSTANPDDMLTANLRNIDLSYVFETLAIDALQFGGEATGDIFVSTVEGSPYANTELKVENFKFNNTGLGHLNLFSEFNDETRMVAMDGMITSKENKKTKVEGTIDPVKQLLSINFDADSIDIGFLNKYSQTIFQDVAGRGTGQIHLFGNFSKVTLEGKAFIEDGGLGINFLNTRYSFTDTVYIKKDLIYFNDIQLKDQYGATAVASGKVTHDYFKNIMYLVDLKAENFLLYNTTASINPLFYGKVFASGNGTIDGDEKEVSIDIRMKTENNTVVRMNFMEDVINEYSFINYKSEKDSVATAKTVFQPLPVKNELGMAVNMNFYIDATPDAVVELVMDPVGGDVLRGSGSGAMQFKWDMKNPPELYGTYNIVRGSYNFTFQRLMERRFQIQEGSDVQFRGDPFQAMLNVSAIYKINASLNDLDKDLAQSTGQTTVPVNCILNLTGALRRPNVGLDIRFPSADAEVERQLKSLINTEDEISKQVASLLILSKFQRPQWGNVDTPTSDFAAIASATLSNQLTNLVSQIDDRWQLGTNLRYSDSELAYTEAELLLSSQLLNDRLLINGNFGYRKDLGMEAAMVHDIDIEYLINNAGTWRIKAYNHYNEKYYYIQKENDAIQTQGIGIVYKKDFDDLYELFHRRRPRTLIPRNDTIVPIVPDSAKKGSSLSPFVKIKE